MLPERLDAAAVIYRLDAALAGLGHPVRFHWRRALPQDATVVLPDGRVLAMVRQGAPPSVPVSPSGSGGWPRVHVPAPSW